jgi:hypothetical protein
MSSQEEFNESINKTSHRFKNLVYSNGRIISKTECLIDNDCPVLMV